MIQQQGFKVEIEPFLKEIKQIPDILINNKYVIELQYSPIHINRFFNERKV